jgi:hypothetical protein
MFVHGVHDVHGGHFQRNCSLLTWTAQDATLRETRVIRGALLDLDRPLSPTRPALAVR